MFTENLKRHVKKKKIYSGAHSRVATLIQPSFQKQNAKKGGGKGGGGGDQHTQHQHKTSVFRSLYMPPTGFVFCILFYFIVVLVPVSLPPHDLIK